MPRIVAKTLDISEVTFIPKSCPCCDTCKAYMLCEKNFFINLVRIVQKLTAISGMQPVKDACYMLAVLVDASIYLHISLGDYLGLVRVFLVLLFS